MPLASRILAALWSACCVLGAMPAPAVAQVCQHECMSNDHAADDHFGESVAMNATACLIGAHYDDDRGVNSGSAYVFRKDREAWVEAGKLLGSDSLANDSFGWDVALSGSFALIGAPFVDGDKADAGAAYVFELQGDQWVEIGKWSEPGSKWFGFSVAILGDRAVVGGGSNIAWVYRFDGSTWSLAQTLTPSDSTSSFGTEVAISATLIAIGAPHDHTAAHDAGSVYVFRETSTGWFEETKLYADDPMPATWFGDVIAVRDETILIGLWRDSSNGSLSGAAYVFRVRDGVFRQDPKILNGDPAESMFGYAVALGPDTALVGAIRGDTDVADSGCAALLRFDGARWVSERRVQAIDAAQGSHFGIAVALHDEHALIGANLASSSGTAYVEYIGSDLAVAAPYGIGYPGTIGVPELIAFNTPRIGHPVTLHVGNSLGARTSAMIWIGSISAGFPTALGGTLWALPIHIAPLTVDPAGRDLTLKVPCLESLIGLSLGVQVLEIDLGAARGVSFTPGLALTFGVF